MPGSAPCHTRNSAIFAYVGAFTTPERKGHGGGINVYRVDPTSGVWSHEQLLEMVNPSFLTLDRTQRFLYSVHADLEEVSAYAIDKQNGRITALNRQSCGGKNPVHLSIDPTGRWIITANYSAGTVGVVPIEKDGNLGPRSDLVNLPGEPGPDRKQQASSHPHDAVFDPSGRFIAVPDKGLDRVFMFRLDAASGKLTPNDPPFVTTRAGAGPRHIAFHPKVPLAYVINELGSSVTTYRFDPQGGSLQPIQIVPSIPPSYTGNNTGAEIAVSPSGQVVYASNRGHDSIAVLSLLAAFVVTSFSTAGAAFGLPGNRCCPAASRVIHEWGHRPQGQPRRWRREPARMGGEQYSPVRPEKSLHQARTALRGWVTVVPDDALKTISAQTR